jgi:hypothetical protein
MALLLWHIINVIIISNISDIRDIRHRSVSSNSRDSRDGPPGSLMPSAATQHNSYQLKHIYQTYLEQS